MRKNNSDYFWVNTNYRKNNPEDHLDMLNNKKAAAYDSTKGVIEKIKEGNKVFLYQNGDGIVAIGIAVEPYNKKGHNTVDGKYIENDEFYISLDNKFAILKAPLIAKKIKELTTKFSFRGTGRTIDDIRGKFLWDYIITNCL